MNKFIIIFIILFSFFNISYTNGFSKDNVLLKTNNSYIITDNDKILIDNFINKLLNFSLEKNINLEFLINRIEKKIWSRVLPIRIKTIIDSIIEWLNQKVCNDYYKIHKNIIASVFWVWEESNSSNAFISNKSSAWDEDWLVHSKNENKYYFALPYNDFDEDWNRKNNSKKIPWYFLKKWNNNESIIKNRWIKFESNWKIAYAQWEDVWPLGEDDFEYVFWDKKSKNTFWLKAWIDLSPDLADYLNIDWEWKVDWNFVPEYCVVDKKFKEKITKSNIYWK